jgi:hypothetical protein
MATITGRYGAVQRVLPQKKVVGGKTRYRWSEFDYKDFDIPATENTPLIKATYEWDGNSFLPNKATEATSIKAVIQPSGFEKWTTDHWVNDQGQTVPEGTPDATPVEGIAGDYSNMVSAVQNWSLEMNVATQTYTGSNAQGYNAKFPGLKSCTGSFQGIGAFPPLLPGNRFLFRGFVGPDNGRERNSSLEYNTNGYVYQVAAIVTNIQIQINYGTFAPITWTVQWQSDYQAFGDQLLVFLPNDNLGFFDVTPPPCNEAQASRSCKMSIKKESTDSDATDLKDICMESANITFTTQTSQTANSCSAKAGGWQQSVVGVTDVTVDATIHGSHYDIFNPIVGDSHASEADDEHRHTIAQRSEHFYPGVDRFVRIFIGDDPDANKHNCAQLGAWEFNKLYIGSFTGLNVDITGGGVVSFRTQMEFNAFPRSDSGECGKGSIRYRLPNSSRTNTTQEWQSFLNLDATPGVFNTGATTGKNH